MRDEDLAWSVFRDGLLFVFMLVVTMGFINPFSSYYTWWNLLYMINNQKERVMNISDMLCDMYDIQRQVKQAKLYDKPKDNDGTSFTIGDCIENVIEQLGESNEQ